MRLPASPALLAAAALLSAACNSTETGTSGDTTTTTTTASGGTGGATGGSGGTGGATGGSGGSGGAAVIGGDRPVTMHISSKYDPAKPAPLMILLHGYGASSVSQGERKNMLKVLPKALPMLRGFNLIDQMQESKGFIGLNMLSLWKDRGTLAPWIDPITALIADGTVRPVVHEAVPFDRAGDAHRILGERRNVGKVVLVP